MPAGRNMEAESSILKGYDGGYGYKHIVEKNLIGCIIII